ncbi:hypothetical protein [Photobacterium profundum]|uniref:Lipoprotein n=1 Tax=Photobacterium profundum (strain SS9) TaxID=298386 RepID=Q6LRM0_PHOPR|nr:hypothetical protein [Photobacterium profundum]CAG20056.1 hypothetical protein PBPRA1645 [Photobacterium profundum SS9]
MFKRIFLISVGISALFLSGCATVLTAEETAPNIRTISTQDSMSLAVLDKRKYVVSEDKAADFEGIIRSGLGIPYTYGTPTKEAMSVYLSNRLSVGFDNHGIKLTVVETEPKMSVNSVVDNLVKNDLTSILIVLNEWKYDFHTFSDNSWYDMDVIVIDGLGNKKLVKNFKGENDVPDGGLISNEMQLIYKQRFENTFSDPEVVEALRH